VLDTKKTRELCLLDTHAVEDWQVMLAHKLLRSDSELPTRPLNERPAPRCEAALAPHTHLMLVRTPQPTPRSLAWARHGDAQAFDATRLTAMLRFERLNLG
jgi:hypothetical protein